MINKTNCHVMNEVILKQFCISYRYYKVLTHTGVILRYSRLKSFVSVDWNEENKICDAILPTITSK